MKKLIAGIILFAVSAAFMAMHPVKAYHSWTLTITSTTKRAYVDSIANLWKRDSIDLNVSKMETGSGGILSKIKGTVSITSMGNKANEKFDYTDVKYCKIKVDNSPHIAIQAK
jgi:hypothetical protein